jgi:hypothetical protein
MSWHTADERTCRRAATFLAIAKVCGVGVWQPPVCLQCNNFWSMPKPEERGYLLTGREGYLAPYTGAIERLQTALSELKQTFDLTERDRTDYQTLAKLAHAQQPVRRPQ